MKYIIGYVLFLVFCVQPLVAQDYYIESLYDAESLAKSTGSFVNNAASIWSNPAALAYLDGKFSVSSFQASFIDNEVQYKNYSIAYKINNNNAIGVGYYAVGIDEILNTKFDSNGEGVVVDSYSFVNNIMKVNYQHKFENVSVGVGLTKYEYKTQAKTQAYSGDLGIIYQTPLQTKLADKLNISIGVQNIYPAKMEFKSKSENIPMIITLGSKLEIRKKYSVYLQRRLQSSVQLTNIGLGFRPIKFVEFSCSKTQELLANGKKYTSSAVGVGLYLFGFQTNISYSPTDYEKQQFYYSLKLNI